MPTTCATGRLDTPAMTLVFDLGRSVAELVYAGARLPATEALPQLALAQQRGLHECEPDEPVPRSILPLGHTGYAGEPVLEVHQAGQLLALGPQPVTVSEQHDGLWFALYFVRLSLRTIGYYSAGYRRFVN